MRQVNIQFTENEANGLLDLIHHALKAEGLAIANEASYFLKKLKAPFNIQPLKQVEQEESNEKAS